MGLDITAYSHLKAIGAHHEGDYCEDEDHVSAFVYDSFPQSFVGIPVLEARLDDGILIGGCYAITPETETHGFRAGSYGGYSRWRQGLQDLYNPQRLESEPFFELIWFADNEGTISSLAAHHLLGDFEAHPEGFVELGEPFHDFHKACKLAAEDGLISFH